MDGLDDGRRSRTIGRAGPFIPSPSAQNARGVTDRPVVRIAETGRIAWMAWLDLADPAVPPTAVERTLAGNGRAGLVTTRRARDEPATRLFTVANL